LVANSIALFAGIEDSEGIGEQETNLLLVSVTLKRGVGRLFMVFFLTFDISEFPFFFQTYPNPKGHDYHKQYKQTSNPICYISGYACGAVVRLSKCCFAGHLQD
jgi:hypothetical protein